MKFIDVCAGYRSDCLVLNNISFNFHASSYALLGPSGIGKTSVLKLMAGLLKPLSGEIYEEIDTRKILLFQENRLLPWLTALENVRLADAERSNENAKYLLESLEVKQIHELPEALSGGMQRRVALARALAFKPQILLMDEPFNGLDEELKIRIAGMLLQLKLQKIILSTHRKEDAYIMNSVAVGVETDKFGLLSI